MKIIKDGKIINEDAVDALSELGNVGAGNATISLSKVLDARVTITQSQVKIIDENTLDEHRDDMVLGIMLALHQDLGGVVIIPVQKSLAKHIIQKMTGDANIDDLSDDISISAVQELANMMASAYATAISSYMGLGIYLTPVMVGMEGVKDLIQSKFVAENENHSMISINTRFSIVDEKGNDYGESGKIIMIPDEKSLDKIIEFFEL